MNSPLQEALGEDWERLPAALQAHYRAGPNVDMGLMDIEFPRWMKPYLWLLHKLGALLPRAGHHVETRVEKDMVDARQYWRRTIRFADGARSVFNSFWILTPRKHVVEFVNPIMGLEMKPQLVGQDLHYAGVRCIIQLGPVCLGLPEWLVLGHTTIVEKALSEHEFVIDFRLTHPIFGQVYRYSGKFVNEKRE